MGRKDKEECVGEDKVEEKTEYELRRDMRVAELAIQFVPVQVAADNL
jgi:hypothetical protein